MLQTAIDGLNLTDTTSVQEDLGLSGITTKSVLNSDIKRTIIIAGIIPDNFVKQCS